MQEKQLYAKPQMGHWVFKKLLTMLESPIRYRFNNPEQLVRASGIMSGQTVLEVGCGSGFFTVSASEMVGKQGLVYAIDVHPEAVEETTKKINDLNITNVKVSIDDAQETCFLDSAFDLILLYGVIPAPVISLDLLSKEMHRLLKPGGILAVWTISMLWSPKSITKTHLFSHLVKKNGVHQFTKNG